MILAWSMLVIASCAKVDQPAAGPGTGGGGQRSGTGGGPGGTGNTPGSGDTRGTVGAGGGGGETSCGVESFDLVRRPVDILVLLDRSASMARDSMDNDIPAGSTIVSKWNQVVPALTQVISQVAGDVSWALKSFPEDGPQCAQTTLTDKIDVQMAPMNTAAITQVVTTTTPAGNGTPTGATFDIARMYLQKLMNDHRKFILFATDGQPSCAGSAGSLVYTGGGSVQAVGAATAAISRAAEAGLHTFVVGVATKPTDTVTLNEWARAGLEARSDPNPLATKYYLGATKAELVSVFMTIANIAQTCVFPFKKAPPVPENIAVKVMGVKAPQDTSATNGWSYSDDTHMSVEVFGSWCDMIKQNAANMVQIIFGCPDVPIP